MKPLLLGHRGLRRTSPFSPSTSLPAENTIAAFESALAMGCDGFEFDVRSTRDGRQVLCHDPVLSGMTIAESTFEQLASACNEPPPGLDEVLRLFGKRAYLDIELKVPGAEAAVAQGLEENPPERGYVLSSFLPEVLLALHQLKPSLPLGFICDRAEYAYQWRELPIGTFIPHCKMVTPGLVNDIHDSGLMLFTWTVNRASDMLRLAERGVDGLISDDPKLLSRTFAVPKPSGEKRTAKGE